MKEKDVDKDWEEFSKWFEDNEKTFHDTQFSDKEIGYAAWLEGIRRAGKNEQAISVEEIDPINTRCDSTTCTGTAKCVFS